MGIVVEWDNDVRTIIRYTFASEWTVEEFFEAFPKGRSHDSRLQNADYWHYR